MLDKSLIRKKFSKLRKKNYFNVQDQFFNPIIQLTNKRFKQKKILLSLYYPSNYEVNVLKIFNLIKKKNIITLLPSINKSRMEFLKWNNKDVLQVNKFGMLEPISKNYFKNPDIMLIPLLSYDKYNNRIGYGKGYYDKFLSKCLKKNKEILTIGVAFSFQKYHKLPTTKYDVKLNFILTEKGLQRQI